MSFSLQRASTMAIDDAIGTTVWTSCRCPSLRRTPSAPCTPCRRVSPSCTPQGTLGLHSRWSVTLLLGSSPSRRARSVVSDRDHARKQATDRGTIRNASLDKNPAGHDSHVCTDLGNRCSCICRDSRCTTKRRTATHHAAASNFSRSEACTIKTFSEFWC